MYSVDCVDLVGSLDLPVWTLFWASAMSKRRRVLADVPLDQIPHVLHTGGVSMQGLAKLVTSLRGDGRNVTSWDRTVLTQTNAAVFQTVACSDELRTTTGATKTWTYADPCQLLSLLVAESPMLQATYEQAWSRSPAAIDRPWSLVIAYDEFVPGNKLAVDHSRKSMVVSMTFLELGGAAAAQGQSWCTPVVVRSSTIGEVRRVARWFQMCLDPSFSLCLATRLIIDLLSRSQTCDAQFTIGSLMVCVWGSRCIGIYIALVRLRAVGRA